MIVTEADLRLMKQLIAKGDFSALLILIERRLEAAVAERQKERTK